MRVFFVVLIVLIIAWKCTIAQDTTKVISAKEARQLKKSLPPQK